MSDKETYCYRILKTYSLIVDFDGQPERNNVPAPVDGETFKQWKLRVLGEQAKNVKVYMPVEPTSNRKLSRLAQEAQAGHLEDVFKAVNRSHRSKKKEAVRDAVERTATKLSTISSDTLQDILKSSEFSLEPSVNEFFERFLKSDNIIDTSVLLEQLVNSFNHLAREVKKYRA